FDAPVVEVFETRAEAIHPGLAPLGPDLAAASFDEATAVARLRDPSRSRTPIGEALLDQRVMAGVGNVFRSEILYLERTDPFAVTGSLDDAMLGRLVATARRLLQANIGPRAGRTRVTTGRAREAAGAPLWVYGRAGRPCRRCGTPIRARRTGRDLPRSVFWCPRCQAPAGRSGVGDAP
ncbi:MAG TPA: hypothetical protein VMH24_01785, partial [Candidatus Sulfotelmatobacter sp.]|nr:hypothetical protein [Candidatus Sulfotelmatobacter sp.]